MALAATAYHALTLPGVVLPDLIIGHGVLGRMLARISMALGGSAPTVWEIDAARRDGADKYAVIDPQMDTAKSYQSVFDASGASDIINQVMPHLARGGEIILAGFYAAPVNFAFPPAFMKEARFRIAAEWARDDLVKTRALIDAGRLSLGGLITHQVKASEAQLAYETAFTDADCLKMILNWRADA